MKNPFDDLPVIFNYTREQALADGVLVDLSDWAREVGFVIPVACTKSLWHRYLSPSDEPKPFGQSERGRAHDMLFMLATAIRRSGNDDRVYFRTIFLQSPNRHVTVDLKAQCGPGDDGEPVVTVMLPDED